MEGIFFFFLDKIISISLYFLSEEEKKSGRIHVSFGNPKIYIGGNVYINCPVVFAENGRPILSIKYKNVTLFKWTISKILVSFEIYDESKNILAKLEDNNWKINPNNTFEIEVSQRKITIYNNRNEVACNIITKKTGEVLITGIFYIAGQKIVANENELRIGGGIFSNCEFSNCPIAFNL